MDARIAAALGQIERRPADGLSVASLAASVNLSASRFAHLFRRNVGTSPARYLHTLRMLRARTLLERTFLTVKEVMAQVGCNDPSHFSRDFRRFHGIAPSECRLGSARERSTDILTSTTIPHASSIAALANERLNRPRKPQPRARAPGIQWNPGWVENEWITDYQGAPS